MKRVTRVIVLPLWLLICAITIAQLSCSDDASVTDDGPDDPTCPKLSYTLTTQAQVDAFPKDCSEVTGKLTIGSSTDITNLSPLAGLVKIVNMDIKNNEALADLDGLSSLRTVTGDLSIGYNPVLASLEGLSSLNRVEGDFQNNGNAALTKLEGLSSLTYVGGTFRPCEECPIVNMSGLSALAYVGNLSISVMPQLVSLEGLSSLTSVGRLDISGGLDKLSSLEGLDALTSIGSCSGDLCDGGLFLGGVDGTEVVDLDGLSNLTFVTEIYLGDNDALTSLDGLSGLTSATGIWLMGNDALTNVDGLSNLVSIEALGINENDNLVNLDGFSGLTSIGGGLSIWENERLENLDGLSGLTSLAQQVDDPGFAVTNNPRLMRCSCGLYACVTGGGFDGIIEMNSNAPSGDCNNNGADLVDGTCPN